jgi:glycine cleavage system H protein
MKVPASLRYPQPPEWVRADPDGTLTVGITDFAQDNLGELVFVETPDPGRKLDGGESCAVVESVKAASDVYAPVAGEVLERNAALADAPNEVNKDPYAAWLFRIRPAAGASLDALMDAAAYRKAFGIA